MKRLLPFITLLLPISTFAYFCPTNGNILLLNTTMDEVTQTCGEPSSTKTYNKTFTIDAKWVYDKQENGSKISAVLHFINGRIEEITLERTPNYPDCKTSDNCETEKSSVTSYSGCTQLVITGNTSRHVRNSCGEPNAINVIKQEKNTYTEFIYKDTEEDLNLLLFKNGKLIQQRHNGY